MIIYNTTYHVDKEWEDRFLNWLRVVMIPRALQSNELGDPRLCRIETEEEAEEGTSYSLQFAVKDRKTLQHWYEEEGVRLTEELTVRFGDRVAGFVTLLRVMEIQS